MLNIIKNTINRVFASGVDSDASAFITATGLSGTTQKSAITTLVKDLKSSGLWSKMKAVYPMVTDNYNLLSYTEDFSNAAWGKVDVSISTNVINAPNGTLTADSLTETTNANVHLVHNSAPLSIPTGNLTSSIYVKKGNRNWFYLNLYNGSTSAICWFNINTGVIGTIQSGITASIQDAGNGWYRLSATRNIATTNNAYVQYGAADADNSTNYVGNGLIAAYIWGAQYELASSASTYQPILTTPSAFMASQMKYNLKDARDLDAAFRLTWSGGWTYSATGATPNGTNAYADTKLNPFVNLVKNNAHVAHYFRTAFVSNVGYGVVKSDYTERMDMIQFSSVLYSAIGASGQTSSSSTPYTSLIVGSRVNSTTNKLYKANTLLNTQTTANSSEFPNANYWLGAVNQSAGLYANNQVAFSSIGDGLTDQEAFLLNQIVEKYQVALSRGVQAAQSFYYNSAYSNEANTYLYSTQITGTTQVSAINTLINGLKANNLWTKMKAVYPFVTDKWNLFSFTEDLTNAAWSKSNVSATLTGTFLGNNVYKLADTTNTNVVHLIAQGPMIVSNTYTVSVNFKKAEYDYAQIFEGGAVFNLANGTVQSALGSNATMVDLGDGWYRCSVTVVSGAANIHIAANKTATSGYSYLSTIGYGIFMSAPQIQYGTIASPYQVISGTNSNTINQTAVAAQMKFNLVNPQDTDAAFRLAFSGGWTYSTNGAQPNGTNGYADTKLVPSTSLSTSSAHFSKYNRTNDLVGNKVDGSIGGTSTFFFQQNYSAGNGIIGEVASIMSYTPTDTRGLFTSTRTSTSLAKQFRNSSQVSSATTTITGMSDRSMFIGARNDATITFYNSYQAAFASIGDGLSDAEVALLNQLVTEYQTSLSRNV